MFENRVLRRIFGPERKEVAGGWRRLDNEEIHNLYASPNIVRLIKSRRVIDGACSTHGRHECVQNFGSENMKGRDLSKELGVDGRILECILGK
jgi:hypothetical protein